MLDEQNRPYSICMRCDCCDGFPCVVHAKSDAEVLGVRPALEHSNVELWTDSEAVRLTTNDAGTEVTGVVVKRGDGEETVSADLVVVSCGAANSARLLLVSATDEHPNGLANGSDQVGRNYMFHNSQAVLALSREENPTVFQKTLGVNDFYFSGPDFEYPMGNIQMVGKSQADDVPRGEARRDGVRTELDAARRRAARRGLLALDGGSPAGREPGDASTASGTITLTYNASNEESKKRLYEQLKSMLGKLDMDHHHLLPHHAYLKNEIPIAGLCAPGRDVPVRQRSEDVGAGRQLQGPRARQPVRRRYELLPEHRRREPGADGDGERAARRRPSARANVRGCAHGECSGGELMSADDGRRHVVIVGGGLRRSWVCAPAG